MHRRPNAWHAESLTPSSFFVRRRISETTTAVDDSSSNAAAKLARFKKHPIGFHVLYQPTDSCGVIAEYVVLCSISNRSLSHPPSLFSPSQLIFTTALFLSTDSQAAQLTLGLVRNREHFERSFGRGHILRSRPAGPWKSCQKSKPISAFSPTATAHRSPEILFSPTK